MVKKYAKRKGISSEDIDRKHLFDLAKRGNVIALEEVHSFFYYLTVGLYNLADVFDSEKNNTWWGSS